MAAVEQGAPLLAFPETHPAWPWRCHIEDGQFIDPATLRVIACDATVSAILHDAAGNVINAGRRSRKPGAALRRAVRTPAGVLTSTKPSGSASPGPRSSRSRRYQAMPGSLRPGGRRVPPDAATVTAIAWRCHYGPYASCGPRTRSRCF
jgi:hypothetical protein